jgi:hypothetical protein
MFSYALRLVLSNTKHYAGAFSSTPLQAKQDGVKMHRKDSRGQGFEDSSKFLKGLKACRPNSGRS